MLEELARIQSHDVVLPTATHGQIRLRCVTQPDPAQAALLDRLGIVLPKRMRLAEHELPALARSAFMELMEKAPSYSIMFRSRIKHAMRDFEGRFVIVSVPNVTDVFSGRDVGYRLQRIDLDTALETITAT
jgi:hypothetical protein